MINLGTLSILITANTTGLNKATRDLYHLERAANAHAVNARASLDAANRAALDFGRTMTQFVTLPVALLGIQAVKTFTEFEFHLAKIEGLVGIAREQTRAWGSEVLALSTQTGKGPLELADALYFVTSSGFKGAEAMDILKVSAQAASAGLGETKYVADIVTSAMNAYGKEVLNASEATDILTATIREGKGEADKMVASMGVALPIASKLGVRMDEVGAAMASMTRVGTTVSTSAVQVRQMLFSLMKPAQASEKALEELSRRNMGVVMTFSDLRNILREGGLLALMDTLMQITHGDSAALSSIFRNVRALNGILELTGENAEETREVFESLANATGSLDTALVAVNETAKIRLSRMWSEIQVKFIEFGEYAAGALIPILEKLIRVMDTLGDIYKLLPKWVKDVQFTLVGLLAILGPLILALNAFGISLKGISVIMLTTPVGLLIGGLSALALVLVSIGSKFKNLSYNQNQLQIASKNAEESIISERKQIASLSKIIQSSNVPLADREDALKRLQDINKEYFGSFTLHTIEQEKLTAATNKYLETLRNEAKIKELLLAKDNIRQRQIEESLKQKDYEKPSAGFFYNPASLIGIINITGEISKRQRDAKAIRTINEELITLVTKSQEVERTLAGIRDVTIDSKSSVIAKTQLQLQGVVKMIENENNVLREAAASITNEALKGKSEQQIQQNLGLLNLIKARLEEISKLSFVPEMTEEQLTEINAYADKLYVISELSRLLGKDYDHLGAKASALKSRIEEMTNPNMTYTEEQKQALVADLNRVNGLIKLAEKQEEIKKSVENYTTTLDILAKKQKWFGSSFNAVDEVLSAMRKRLDDIAEFGGASNKEIETLVANIKRLEELKWGIENMKKMTGIGQGTVLNPLPAVFTDLTGQERAVKQPLEIEKLKEFGDETLKTAEKYNKLGNNITSTNKMMLKTAKEFFDEWVIQGEDWRTALQNTFLSVETMQAQLWETLKSGAEALRNAMVDIFTSIGEGIGNAMANADNPFDGLVQSLLSVVKTIGKLLITVGTILLFATGGTVGWGFVAGGIALTALSQFASVKYQEKKDKEMEKIPGMAKGGIVPPGYPNDTFLARLSSGEEVIPVGHSRYNNMLEQKKQKVVFVIDGHVIQGILQDANNLSNIY